MSWEYRRRARFGGVQCPSYVLYPFTLRRVHTGPSKRNFQTSTTYGQSFFFNILVVGQPSEELQNVQAEIVPQLGDFVDVLVGSKANRDKVLYGLQQPTLLVMAISETVPNHSRHHSNFMVAVPSLYLI